MTQNICKFQYTIPDIPDPACTKYKIVAGGNIRDSIASGCGHLLRTLSHMPSGKVWAKIIFVFKPSNGNLDMQSRLKLILEVGSDNEDTLSSLQKLIQGGLLSRFYDFNSSSVLLPDSGKLNCRCNIIRRQDFLSPLYNCEFNHKIPELYYTMTPFEANSKNDYLILDKVLDRVDEEVSIGIKVTPADISRQLHVHTAYLARLNSINRNWDDDYEDSGNSNYTGLDVSGYKSNHASLKPLSYKDPMADDVLRRQRRFHESLSLPHLHFEIEVSTQTQQAARLIGSVIAESAFRNGSYRLILNSDDEHADSIPQMYKELMNLSNVAIVDELIGVFCLPVGSSGSPLCIRKNTDPEYIEPDKLIVLGYDQHNLPRGIHINVLKKHCAVLGLSGVGKSTNNINIEIQLSKRDIPFLVIESAKTEYRVLKKFSSHKNPAIKKLAQKLRVFTVGNETSPLAINPLRVPVGISLNEHIENLLACFKAVLPVSSGSIPSLLGEALEIVYEQFPDPGKPPVMSDLVATVQQVLDSKGYSPNTRSDMQTVIEVRLGVLAQRLIGKVFGCRKGVSIAELMENPTIVEIDKLCGEQKCLLTLFILMGIREVLRTSPSYEGPLRFVILIEEAHNIFGSSRNAVASEEVADPKSQLTEFLFQMMVELRALGVAIILSDQHPSSLDPGAIKTPASKVGFLQVANGDREVLGGSMLFNEIEKQDIARLRPGEAFLFTEGYYYPIRIKTINLHEQFDLSNIPDDKQLHQIISTEDWFIETRIKHIEDELDQFKDCLNLFDEKRKQINLETQRLVQLKEKVGNLKNKQIRSESLDTIVGYFRIKKNTLSSDYKRLLRNIEKRFGHLHNQDEIQNENLENFSKVLFSRFDKVIKSCVNELLSFIDSEIKKCNQLKLKERFNG